MRLVVGTFLVVCSFHGYSLPIDQSEWPQTYGELEELFDSESGEMPSLDDFIVGVGLPGYHFVWNAPQTEVPAYQYTVEYTFDSGSVGKVGGLVRESSDFGAVEQELHTQARTRTRSRLKVNRSQQVVTYLYNEGCFNTVDHKAFVLSNGFRVVVRRGFVSPAPGCPNLAVPHNFGYFVVLNIGDEVEAVANANLYDRGDIVGEVRAGSRFLVHEVWKHWISLKDEEGAELPGWLHLSNLRGFHEAE